MPKVRFKKNRLMKEDVVVDGAPGRSILSVASSAGVPVGSNCGGVCACSTCHVVVLEGGESLEEMSNKEQDRIVLAFDVRLESRLGCQATLGESDLVVEITNESLAAFLDENPDIRKRFDATGEFTFVPHERG